MGSPMAQNKMPMPMPEHSEMANQRKKLKSGFASLPPMRMLPIGEQTMPKVNSMTRKLKNTEAHPRSLTILSCNKSMKRIKGSGNAMALTINAKTDKKPMAKGMVSRRFPSVRTLNSSCIQATSLNSNAFCLGGRRQGVRP